MQILCDVHIPLRLVNYFSLRNLKSMHVNHMPNKWYTTDKEISSFADLEGWIVLTKDSDFKVSHFATKRPKKVVRIILGNISYNELEVIFDLHFNALQKAFEMEAFYIEIGRERIEVFVG